ncbi:hypothetical protein OQH61_02680 [Helicobacter sp. MIT 21-1697]|uniref:hypothetical protein n=1 Tax=Helicobacter sp. MIT 21-1697 TaxID=2993733 RepID=UPI00224B72E5|nr:hypothetical protein [Helicobacter sp. MIT 21-1697]MCX2716637.1 hypothetical protein [Helicobacter sp. MIT 21-1697]
MLKCRNFIFRFLMLYAGIFSASQVFALSCEETLCKSLRVGVGIPLYQTFVAKDAHIGNSGGYFTLGGRLITHRILAEANGQIGIGRADSKESYFENTNYKGKTTSSTLAGDIKLGVNVSSVSLPIFIAGVYGFENFSLYTGGIFSNYKKDDKKGLAMSWHYAGAEINGSTTLQSSSKIEYLLGYYYIINQKSNYRFRDARVISDFAGTNYMIKASLAYVADLNQSVGYYVRGIYKYQNFAASKMTNNLNYPTTQNFQVLAEVGLEF